MKKIVSLLLTASLIVASMVIPSAATAGSAPTGAYYDAETATYVADAGVITEVIADLDFEDAVLDTTGFATLDEATGLYNISVASGTYVPIASTNKGTSDLTPIVETKANSSRSETGVETPYLNTSNQGVFYSPRTEDNGNTYLRPDARKKQAKFQFTIDKFNEETQAYEKAGVAPTGTELVYLDYRVNRYWPTNDDGMTLSITDHYGNTIASMTYENNKYPKLTASTTYGADAFTAEEPATNYINGSGWQCIRFIMNFDTKTFKLYVGDDWSTLKPYTNDNDNYTMQKTNAIDFYKLYIGDKGSLAIDDIAVYKVVPPVAPVASNAVLTGKLNLGATLSCTYEYECSDGALEGASYAYWEAADNVAFTDAVTLTENIPVKAGEVINYAIDSAASGKYVRCVIVPVNVGGVEGDTVTSNATAYLVDGIDISIGFIGNIKWDHQFDLKHANNGYYAKATIASTLSEVKNYALVGAFYVIENDADGNPYHKMIGIKTLAINVPNAAETETGVSAQDYTTEQVFSVAKTDTNKSNYFMKVMLVDSLGKMRPVCDYNYATFDGGQPAY